MQIFNIYFFMEQLIVLIFSNHLPRLLNLRFLFFIFFVFGGLLFFGVDFFHRLAIR